MDQMPMDEAAREAAYALADQQFPLIYKLECPTCETRNVGPGCGCMGNERTCVNGHHFCRCQVHEGYVVAIPPPKQPHRHYFASWLGQDYWKEDKRCACELAILVWDIYNASDEKRANDARPSWHLVHDHWATHCYSSFCVYCSSYSLYK